MRKLVNGKVINIDNIELFEKAAEGAAVSKVYTKGSSIYSTIAIESNKINEYIEVYRVMYKAMPFPLYYIEENIKYAAAATFIKKCSDRDLDMWVDKALYIVVDKDSKSAIQFKANTWSVVRVSDIKEDNTSLEEYKGKVGYEEFKWIIDKIMGGQTTKSFYKEFMGEFISACNNDRMIMQWELSNILNFGSVPEKIELKENKIINIENKHEYSLDIYYAGKKKTGEQEYYMSLYDDCEEFKLVPKYVKVYGYDAYEKTYIEGSVEGKGVDSGKIKKSKVKGLNNLFNTLTSIRIAGELNHFENFKGIIAERDIIYYINNRIFVCKAYRQGETKEIARGVSLHSYDRGIIYMVKAESVSNKIKKETTYSYGLRDGKVRVCRVQFNS